MKAAPDYFEHNSLTETLDYLIEQRTVRAARGHLTLEYQAKKYVRPHTFVNQQGQCHLEIPACHKDPYCMLFQHFSETAQQKMHRQE